MASTLRSARLVAAAAVLTAASLWTAGPAQSVSVSVQAGTGQGAGDWIVLFDDSVEDVVGLARQEAGKHDAELKDVYQGAIKGFTARFKPRQQGKQPADWDRRVRLVERDQLYTTVAVTQPGAVPGLDRIDQQTGPLSTTFTYDRTGEGVRAYVLDTGVLGAHTEFGSPSRVEPGFDATSGGLLGLFGSSKPKPGNTDCHGHGTHVAGTIAGKTYGVAKGATIVPVKVLGCGGSGSTSQIVKGIDWMITNLAASKQTAAVANMSLGGAKSTAMDDAVRRAIGKGITFAVAAGNSDANACNSSPSGVTQAMTVGAIDPLTDRRPSFSNWGICVDLFAPGVNITSAGRTNVTSTASMSGTSMAAPHTAGVVAQYLQQNPGTAPATVQQDLRNLATTGKVIDPKGSPNKLLFTNL